MRKIKFRAWWIQQRKMDYLELKDFKNYSFPLYWCKIMQYTGLKDKNNKEIYEGDIIEVTDGDEWVISTEIAEINGEFLSIHPDCIGKIIGNIYENPKLKE